MIEESLPMGSEVAGYVIERVLGQGGFAITYLAHDAHLVESRVALKEYFPQDLARRTQRVQVAAPAPRAQAYQEGLERFLEEARTLTRLPEHPSVVRAHRYVPANGTAYLVMEYVAGESLAEALKRHPRSHWTEGRVRRLAAQLLDALRVVHGAGVWHRDVNPTNLLLRADERPVLIDFGASRQVQAARTRTGQRVATAGYSPPEQYGGDYGTPGPWSDLYALGATLYEVVTGVQPAESLARLAAQRKGRDPLIPAVAAASGLYSADLLSWIDGHLALEETARPQTAEASQAGLLSTVASKARAIPRTAPVGPNERFTREKSAETPKAAAASAPQPPAASPSTRNVEGGRRTIAGVAALVLLVVAGGLWWWRASMTSAPVPQVPMADAGLGTPREPPAIDEAASSTAPEATVPLPLMVEVPGGSFQMGSPSYEEGRDEDEGPVRSVQIKGFRLGKYEVTRGEFHRFVEATGYRTEAERDVDVPDSAGEWAKGPNPGCWSLNADGQWGFVSGRSWRDAGIEQEDDHPVVCVSWNDAKAYIEWLNGETGRGFRLPSEAEQEYAIRAGSRTPYAWGTDVNEACAHANVADQSGSPNGGSWNESVSCADGSKGTSVVGRYRANGFGLYDAVGNALEWGEDCYGSYAAAPVDGSAVQSSGCTVRVLRGASWGFGPSRLRSAGRGRADPTVRSSGIGFRLAEDL